ncbi:MAG: glycine--tRNA ligase [Erysipelotrichaceae bacterium]|nr:glycine--tRNA ligase [Erysipelotrichaceae bacterium]MDD3809980.1 glycine--tRNA ligase [Erysipelotrichaceae bacterium]
MSKYDMEKLVAHAKSQGFVYQGSEIYDGLANTWDYGPLGVELKNNIKQAWWKRFIQESPYNVGLDSAIFMNSKVWEASGHVDGFSDPLIDCKSCKTRHRADKLIEAYDPDVHSEGWENAEVVKYIKDHNITCPNCGSGDFTDVRQFKLMFETHMGVVEDAKDVVYLRPETAQGIFVNFKNIQRTSRKKVPFGIGQIGKSFRNEITPGNFIFRTREFEQMELEFFCQPGTDLEWFEYWKEQCRNFLLDLGLNAENLKFRDHQPEELSFYSKATCDVEYQYPFGWGELWGIADRTDYDLGRHQEVSKKNLEYLDPTTNEKYLPYVIEPSVGADRLFLAILCDSIEDETLEDGTIRTVMHLDPKIAPVKVAILPLTKKLSEKGEEVYQKLIKEFNCEFDLTGQIGKRYRRQDAIGTPYCVTVDFDTLEDNTVTVRERDSMEQVRMNIDELSAYFNGLVRF